MSDDLFITTNQPRPMKDLNFRLVPDEVPGQGALYGLKTALQAACYDDVLLVACDMPFIALELVDHLRSLVGKADVIIPRLDASYEPLLAVYRASTCLPAIDRSLEAGNARMISFFSDVKVLPIETEVIDRLDPQRLSFFNLNTPEDVLQAEAIIDNSSTLTREQLHSRSAHLPNDLRNGESK
jgi:molybdopterin-guanine dinucleotide biosynthesis protein A